MEPRDVLSVVSIHHHKSVFSYVGCRLAYISLSKIFYTSRININTITVLVTQITVEEKIIVIDFP